MNKMHTMCGDQPSFTKAELNKQVSPLQDKEKKENLSCLASLTRVSPSTSGVASEGSARLANAKRHLRNLELVRDTDHQLTNDRLLNVTLSSLRYPPYLLLAVAGVVLLTHALHAAAAVLERALPTVLQFSQYLRKRTIESWTDTKENNICIPLLFGLATGVVYTVYYTLFVIYSVAIWSIEPIISEMVDREDANETKVTNYEEIPNKSAINLK